MSAILEPLAGSASYLVLLIRLFLGASLIIHGYPKVRGGWKQSAQWVKSMGIPASTAVAATIVEFLGGILLIVGLIIPVVSAFVALEFAAIIAMKRSKMHAAYISFEQGETYLRDQRPLSRLGFGSIRAGRRRLLAGHASRVLVHVRLASTGLSQDGCPKGKRLGEDSPCHDSFFY